MVEPRSAGRLLLGRLGLFCTEEHQVNSLIRPHVEQKNSEKVRYRDSILSATRLLTTTGFNNPMLAQLVHQLGKLKPSQTQQELDGVIRDICVPLGDRTSDKLGGTTQSDADQANNGSNQKKSKD